MSFFYNLYIYLLPEALLESTKWLQEWKTKVRNDFSSTVSIFYFLAGLAYIFHYFFVDLPQGLQPHKTWLIYRMSMASLCFLCFLGYKTEFFMKLKFYRLPFFISCMIMCYLQTKTIHWFSEVPYLYSFVLIFVVAGVSKLNILYSIILTTSLFVLQINLFLALSVNFLMIISAFSVTLICTIFNKYQFNLDLKLFLKNKEFLESERENVEVILSYSDEIKKFLPKEICKRIEYNMNHNSMSILNATEDVLKPIEKEIVCLHTDIRGFTEASKDTLGYLMNGAIPEIQGCVQSIENHSGIPRIIGDLVLAYFDHNSQKENILRAMKSSFEIISHNKNLNTDNAFKVKRYLILSIGQAIVGNIGGQTSREITSLGTPVNLVSRIDEVTKMPSFQEKVNADSLILSNDFKFFLRDQGFEFTEFSLKKINLEIRNFPHESNILVLDKTKQNQKILEDNIKSLNFDGDLAA